MSSPLATLAPSPLSGLEMREGVVSELQLAGSQLSPRGQRTSRSLFAWFCVTPPRVFLPFLDVSEFNFLFVFSYSDSAILGLYLHITVIFSSPLILSYRIPLSPTFYFAVISPSPRLRLPRKYTQAFTQAYDKNKQTQKK